MKSRIQLLAFCLFVTPVHVLAAPAISDFSGNLAHGSVAAVDGQGFGSKSSPRPQVWENCASGSLSSDWSGAWPNRSANKTHDTACRAPLNGIELPHSNATRYVAGSHAESGGYNAGSNVMLFKPRSITTYPAYTYASWYQRVDDAWHFCDDNNFKTYDFSTGTSPYDPENWYLEYNGRPSSPTSGAAYHLNDNGNALQNPDANGHSWWWSSAINPMGGKWTKVEVEIRYARDSSGYVKLWENGNLRVDYRGRTDNYSGSQRNDAIGGYARCSGPNNWRYFSDLYLDHSRARLVLANNADYSKATIVEPQIPTTWSDSRIEFTVNLGRITDPDGAFLFVFDANGSRNSTGFKVSDSGAAAPRPPSPVVVE